MAFWLTACAVLGAYGALYWLVRRLRKQCPHCRQLTMLHLSDQASICEACGFGWYEDAEFYYDGGYRSDVRYSVRGH